MRKKWAMSATIIGIILIGAVVAGPIMSDVETPKYDVVTIENNIEIRQYDPMIIAEVQMEGRREDSIGDGFRLLADYIFGNNMVKQDIAMTAPVQQQKSTKIAMTAPVQQQQKEDSWQISFVMPSQYSMGALPKPINDLVTLKKIPTKQFVVITFSGTNSDENIKENEKRLMAYVRSKSISVIGSPKYAFYNPPWTLPFMRRNEVMIEIQGQ